MHGGDEKGVGLLANVIAVRAQPQQLLLGLQQALPAPQSWMLLSKLAVSSKNCKCAELDLRCVEWARCQHNEITVKIIL